MKAKDSDLISVEVAQQEFGIGRSTIFRAINAKKLQRVPGGLGDRKVYVSRKALARLVQPGGKS